MKFDVFNVFIFFNINFYPLIKQMKFEQQKYFYLISFAVKFRIFTNLIDELG